MSLTIILESLCFSVQSNPREKSIVTSSQGGLGIGRAMYNFVFFLNSSFATKNPIGLNSSFPSLNSLRSKGSNLIQSHLS